MLHFNEKTHSYQVHGKPVPHVTQVTDLLASYAGVPWAVLERKRQIGEAVHYATELDDQDDLDFDSVPAEIRGYVSAWRAFKEAAGFVCIANERKVWSDVYQYAGTLDRVCRLPGLKGVRKDQFCLIDIKTTYALMPAVGPQLAAYQRAWDEHEPKKIAHRFAVQLRPDGTFKPEECREETDWNTFLSALNLLRWRQRHHTTIQEIAA